jgi:LacI family transcriptional regulator
VHEGGIARMSGPGQATAEHHDTSHKKVTLIDIARSVGVSTGTVDRALHNRKGVNPLVKAKIMATAEAMNYKPNRLARSLSIRTSKKIGLIYPKNPAFFWDKIKKGFDTAAMELEELGMDLMPIRFDSLIGENEHKILRALDELQERDVSAIIVVPYSTPALQEKIKEINQKGIPILTLSTDINDRTDRFLYLGPDNYRVGRMAAELIGKLLRGTGDLLVLSQPLNTSAYRQRWAGFQELLSQSFPSIIIRRNYRYDGQLREQDRINIGEIINANPVKGIYCLMSDPSFWETAEIVSRSSGSDRPVVVGHELNDRVIDLIEKNVITAAICQHPVSQGYRLLKILYDFLFDQLKPPQSDIYARIDIVMKENCRNYDRWTELP